MSNKRALTNTAVASLSKILYLVIAFISRKILIRIVAVEFLGLSSLYANLLDFLNLSELGLGVAIQIRMYKPLVENDHERVYNILQVTRKIYWIIGSFIIIAGIILTFFLRFIIKDNPFSLTYVSIAFLISVAGIGLSYFIADKRLFFDSNEQSYIPLLSDLILKIVAVTVGIILVYFTKEYMFYFALTSTQLLISNTFTSLFYRRKEKEIRQCNKNMDIQKTEIKEIKKNMKNVLPSKIAVYVFFSTDSIVISAFVGLADVAIYANYIMLINGLFTISSLVSTVLVSTFGKKFSANEDITSIKKSTNSYWILQFMFSSFTTVGFFCLLNQLIDIWVGSQYFLATACVYLLVADYFIHSMFQPLSMLYTAAGRFKEDKITAIIAASLNIVISIVLAIFFGVIGVILGTIISNIFTLIIRVFVVYKKVFNAKLIKPYLFVVICLGVTILECLAISRLTNITVSQYKMVEFIYGFIICLILPNVINLIIYIILKKKTDLFNFKKLEEENV